VITVSCARVRAPCESGSIGASRACVIVECVRGPLMTHIIVHIIFEILVFIFGEICPCKGEVPASGHLVVAVLHQLFA
jgi:hypothetical protein